MSQLVGRIGKLLSQETDNAGLPSNLFTASYDSDQRRKILNITDNTYSFIPPIDTELQELAAWQEMNDIVGNYEEQKPTSTTWTSGLMNLNPFNSLFIVCTELSVFIILRLMDIVIA